ncbi:hypothetical protein GCM10010517_64300 [Streptosporangium fragile]|uniref:Mersacidin/lichenicidin family type 2 lantibiotic n=1 Tax=Streptosporangium fragile TaxID=46186 RepID=A0ABN3W6F7_9ACTN
MSNDEIVRLWKDPAGRAASADDVAHPAGSIDLGLEKVAGGDLVLSTEKLASLGCCNGLTSYVGCWEWTGHTTCWAITLGCA